MTGIRVRGETQTHREEGVVTIEAEIGVVQPQAKEHQASLATS